MAQGGDSCAAHGRVHDFVSCRFVSCTAIIHENHTNVRFFISKIPEWLKFGLMHRPKCLNITKSPIIFLKYLVFNDFTLI